MIQTVFSLILKGDEFLLIQEQGLAKGLWCLPGGHMNEGETLEQAAVREAREEAGIESNVVKYFDRYEGYISSHDYERADDAKLAALAKKIRE